MHVPVQDYLIISVGAPSPFPPLPADQLTVATSLGHTNPVVIVSIPEVTAEDIANIMAPLHAVALRRSTNMPAGAILLLLGTSEQDVWPICAPFLDDAALMGSWARDKADSNNIVLALVDAETQIVRAQRTIALPLPLLEMVRHGILSTDRIDERAAMEEMERLNDRDVWAQSTCWQGEGGEVFKMIAARPVLP